MKNIKRKHILEAGLALFAGCFIFYYWNSGEKFLRTLLSALNPFLIGAVMAYVVNILMSFYERNLAKWWKKDERKLRPLTMVLAILSFVLAVIFVLGIVLPQLIASLYSLVNVDPGYINGIISGLSENTVVQTLLDSFHVDLSSSGIAGQISEWIQRVLRGIGGITTNLLLSVSRIFNTVYSLFMAVIFAIYVLSGKETLCSQADQILKAYLPKKREKIRYLTSVFDGSFHRYFSSQIKEAFILGFLVFASMRLFRLPYASSIATLVGFTALIPVFGNYIGMFIGAIMVLTVSLQSMLVYLIVYNVVQQFENNVIYPRVVGSSVGLPGMWVLVAVAVGGALFNFVGVLIAVPVAASLYFLFKEDVRARTETLQKE